MKYLAVVWNPSDARAERQQSELRDRLARDQHLVVTYEAGGVWLACPATRPLAMRSIGSSGGLIVGELFCASGQRPAPMELGDLAPDGAVEAKADRLLGAFWGRYVALLWGAEPMDGAVLRDPSGGLSCVVWRLGWLTLISSDAPVIRALQPTGMAVAWDWLGGIVRDPALTSAVSPLVGVNLVTPGALRWIAPPHQQTLLWRPSHFARKPLVDELDARAALKAAVTDSVTAQSAHSGPVLAEMSGGLDSGIVSSVLASAPDVNVAAWLNFVVGDRGGDERHYAEALADKLAVDLSVRIKPPLVLGPEDLERTADGPSPSLIAFDTEFDAALVAEGARTGAVRLLTGQGGDAVFFQSATPLAFADHLRRLGRSAFRPPYLGDTARWMRASAWSVLAASLLAGFGAGPPATASPPDYLATPLRRRRPPMLHPWLQDVDGIAPAKRLHIRHLTYCLTHYGRARRSQAMELIHPLLSQPVLETCLAIPVDVLAYGGRDRALARAAFADRLPTSILKRRSKGETNVYYGRAIAAALDWLRPYLLDGLLSAHDLFDRPRLEARLDADRLAWKGDFAELFVAIAVEAWARRWTSILG